LPDRFLLFGHTTMPQSQALPFSFPKQWQLFR